MTASNSLRRKAGSWVTVAAIAALALMLTACGGGGGGGFTSPPPGPPPPPAGRAPVLVRMGDAPVDSVVAFEITVTSITLTDINNVTVSVLSAPRRIELSHNSAHMEPLSAMNIPQGTYTKATITVASPEVKIVNGAGAVVELATTLASATATVPFSPQLTVGSSTPVSLNFDFNLAASLTIAGASATVNPAFTVGTSVVVGEAEQDDESGEVEDLTGKVTSVAAPNFTLAMGEAGTPMTFATNSSTEFEGVSGVDGLQPNMLVEVDAFTQSDGTFLAKKVEVEEADADGLEAEGIVTSISGMPNSFQLIVQDESSPTAAIPSVGDVIKVDVDPSTRYRIQDSDRIDLSGLGFTPTFDAATLAPGQSVEVDTDAAGMTSINADAVKLHSQALTGVVSSVTPLDESHISFTLTPAADAAFVSLSGSASLTVVTTGKTEMKHVASITNGATLRVRGLLFFQSGAYTMVAAKVTTP